MATFREKNQRDFRIYSGSKNKPVPLDFSKIKVGKSTITGEIASLIDNYAGKRVPRKFTREMVNRAIDNNDLKTMRMISDYYFRVSGIYSRLCRYMAYLFRYDWLITPHRYDVKIKDDKVVEGWIKSSIYLENCDLKSNLGDYALNVVTDGCLYGYILDKGTASYLQKLPSDYCRSRYVLDGNPVVEFNIKFFDDAFADNAYKLRVLKTFPKEFQKAYIAYKSGELPRDFNGDDSGWFLLDPSKSVKFSLLNGDAPLFMSVIPAILDLEDAKQLDKDKMAQQLLKIIIQKMPIDKNGDLIFDVQEAQALHNNAVGMVGDAIGVDVLTTFADVDVADLSDRSNVSSVDELERVERSLFNESGTPQQLFNTSGQNALEKSVANDEATMYALVNQFRTYAERLLGAFNKNPKRLQYKVTILPTTIYNYKELSKMYKDQTQIGFSKLLPQIALGMSQSDIIATAIFENQVLNLNELFVPPQMSSTMSSKGSSGSGDSGSSTNSSDNEKGGRPEKPMDEKSEKTLRNIESSS